MKTVSVVKYGPVQHVPKSTQPKFRVSFHYGQIVQFAIFGEANTTLVKVNLLLIKKFPYSL